MTTQQATTQMTSEDVTQGLGKPGFGPDLSMKVVPFTQEGIQNFLGPRFQVRPSRQGNFQVNIANMRASSDTDKIVLLYRGLELLRSRGFSVTAKLTYRSQRTQRFENWPCLWVDAPTGADKIQQLTNTLQRLIAKLQANGVELDLEDTMQAGGGDAFEEDREIEPSEEDVDHAAMIERNKQEVAKGNVRSAIDPMYREPTLNQPSPGYSGDEKQHGGEVKPGRAPTKK